jgi:hypothetical protein
MTSDIQIESNKINSEKSTGPTDTSLTRFNAVRFGLTGKCFMTPEEIKTAEEIYGDLAQCLSPQDTIEKFLVYRMAQVIIRLQKVNHVESAVLQNSLISKENHDNNPLMIALGDSFRNPNEKSLLRYENLSEIELLARYETNLENRLTKLLKVYYEKRGQFS